MRRDQWTRNYFVCIQYYSRALAYTTYSSCFQFRLTRFDAMPAKIREQKMKMAKGSVLCVIIIWSMAWFSERSAKEETKHWRVQTQTYTGHEAVSEERILAIQPTKLQCDVRWLFCLEKKRGKNTWKRMAHHSATKTDEPKWWMANICFSRFFNMKRCNKNQANSNTFRLHRFDISAMRQTLDLALLRC